MVLHRFSSSFSQAVSFQEVLLQKQAMVLPLLSSSFSQAVSLQEVLLQKQAMVLRRFSSSFSQAVSLQKQAMVLSRFSSSFSSVSQYFHLDQVLIVSPLLFFSFFVVFPRFKFLRLFFFLLNQPFHFFSSQSYRSRVLIQKVLEIHFLAKAKYPVILPF